MKKSDFARHIQSAGFHTLFNELGWDFKTLHRDVAVGEHVFRLEAVAEKRDFYVMRCGPDTHGKLPDQNARRSINRQFEKVKNYFLLLFTDKDNSEQVWQFVLRLPNRPPKYVETRWRRGQDVELLYQKVRGLFFDLDEEGNITIVDVIAAVQQSAGQNAEKVTKKFYDGFKKEHTAFLGFIQGIRASVDKDWYASLMLNRLMFCYFIQKKRFLDNNPDYLSHKLREVRDSQGTGRFYSFYRDFLLVLFHKGLNERGDKPALIGQVPYLNGGLFDVHELETRYPDIRIPDEAFERIFKFFDKYEWHLDNRTGRGGNEINPDVIGYIFEKYINDRADMGAYYTKEDITEYIAKNCIIPFLFDEAARRGANLQPCFTLLRDDPDRYIYPAVKHGITWDYRRGETLEQPVPLPPDIADGLDTGRPGLVQRRKAWNREAPPEAGLPTEWWRETVERRHRYTGIKAKLQAGEVTRINDLITLNLDIRRFAQDALEYSDDPEFVRCFYAALSQVSVLDPTCGSGAFLFAALNILEPLYETCLDRMAAFVKAGESKNRKYFQEVVDEAYDPDRHPDAKYYIYKKIIVHNLYGVDIMREAVEIAKLRLFLKLMSTVEADRKKTNLGLEPLPDVDFNIRAGNTLVGFATLSEAIEAIHRRDNQAGQQGRLVFGEELEVVRAVEEKAELVANAYARFQDAQVVNDQGSDAHHRAKNDLRSRLTDLNDALNTYCAFRYGIERGNDRAAYDQWLASHQPFHWFAEFYGVLYDAEGKFKGFDCVIGNPPYVEYTKNNSKYAIINFDSINCGNLYGFICERSNVFTSEKASLGFIIPISFVSIDDFSSLRKLEFNLKSELYMSHFAIRPAKLFNGVEQRLTISLSFKNKNHKKGQYSSKYHQWYKDERQHLFECLEYTSNICGSPNLPIPKTGRPITISIISKIQDQKSTINEWLVKNSPFPIFFHRTPGYWIRIMNFLPYFKSPTADKSVHHIREIFFNSEHHRDFVGAVVGSSMYFLYFFTMGNCRNLTYDDILKFKVGKPTDYIYKSISNLFKQVMKSFQENSFINHRGDTEFQEFNWGVSKPILDEIDTILAEHYGFTEEELDFIINYDIKYRMGRGSTNEEED